MFLYFTIRLTASDICSRASQRDLDAGRIEESVAAYATSQRWHPAGSSDDLYFSRALGRGIATRLQSAPARDGVRTGVPCWRERAAKTSEEQQNAWYNLAGFYAARNDDADVEACLRRSVEASPNWFKSHWALAQLLLLSDGERRRWPRQLEQPTWTVAKDPEIAKFLQSVHDSATARKPE